MNAWADGQGRPSPLESMMHNIISSPYFSKNYTFPPTSAKLINFHSVFVQF